MGNRPKSAKGRNISETGLRESRVSGRDYSKSSRKSSAHNYKVTVPVPFKFDMRERSKSKTIREVKLEEMVDAKKQEEEDAMSFKFRHNAVPTQVLVPKYDSIIKSNQDRREGVKKNSIALTQQREKPFSFYARDKNKQERTALTEKYGNKDLTFGGFKANPVPKSSLRRFYHEKTEVEEQMRNERIHKAAQLSAQLAKLPPRMELHSKMMKNAPPPE